MARLKFKIQHGLGASFRNILKKAINKRVRNGAKKLTPLIVRTIDNTVEESQGLFIPTDEDAVELGVGSDGYIDSERLSSAWKLLKVGAGGLDFSFNTDVGISSSIGTVRVLLNRENFFSAEASNIPTPDSNVLTKIPWMKWFIEGKEIGGARLSKRRPIAETSRTGRGIMITNGFWSFPDNEANVDLLIARIKDDLRNAIGSTGAKILEG